MKKFALCLIACFAIVQSTYAATSALTESLLEYQAITNAIGSNPAFQSVIPATEFIVDIKRITKQVNVLGTVKYKIVTRVLSDTDPVTDETESCHKHHRPRFNTYIAVLNVAQNPGVGPNIVTVESITKVTRRH